MTSIIKNQKSKIINCLMSAMLLLLFSGCNDDLDNSSPYLYISNMVVAPPANNVTPVISASEHGFNVIPDVGNPEWAVVTYDLRSNRDWKIVFESGNEDGWLMAYPAVGSGDGKLRFCVRDNDHIVDRTALAVVYFGDGTATDVQFAVGQEANLPYIRVIVNGRDNVTRSSSGRPGGVVNVRAVSNVDYIYTKSAGTPWFNLVEGRRGEITLTVEPLPENFTDELREGTITFRGIGVHSHLERVLRVVQSIVSIDGATQITIEEILERYDGDVVEENLFIRGIVISDIDNRNIPANQMVVQDRSGKGILFTFENASDNVFKVGSEITVWMFDKEINNAAVTGFAADNNVFDIEPDVGWEDVIKTISDLNNPAEHLNCLVRITNAEWMFPYGTYFAGDEVSATSVYTPGNLIWSDKARMVRSTGGGAIRAYVLGGAREDEGATFKHARLLPQGNGALTGIIMNRHDDFERLTDMIVLRMRSIEDDEIPETGDRGYMDIVEFVFPPFEFSGSTPILTTKGAGVLRSSMDNVWRTDQTSGQLYRSYAYWRTDANIAAGGVQSATYSALNTASFEGSNSANSLFAPNYPFSEGGINGEGWIVTFSTAGLTANDEVVLGFATSSSATGPRDFAIDWGEAVINNGEIDWSSTFAGTFTTFAHYECTNWSVQVYAPEFMFVLPPESHGKENVVLRLRVNGTRRANLGATNTAFVFGGTNRLCGLVISTRQK